MTAYPKFTIFPNVTTAIAVGNAVPGGLPTSNLIVSKYVSSANLWSSIYTLTPDGLMTTGAFVPTSSTVPAGIGYYAPNSTTNAFASNGRVQVRIFEDPDPGFPASGTDISTWIDMGGHRCETAAADGSVIILANGTGQSTGSYTHRLTSKGPNGQVHICNYDPATGSRIIANFDSATLSDDHHTYINFANADDGQSPAISTQRTYVADSSNFGLNFYTEGSATNTFRFLSDSASLELHQIRRTASSVNYTYTQSAATGTAVKIGVDGSDTNADIKLESKGTGGGLIKGRTDGAAVPAGYVGEVIEATLVTGSQISLSSGAATTILSLSLTKGVWSIDGTFITDGTNTTGFFNQYASISETTNVHDTTPGKLNGINDVTGTVRWANGDDLYVQTPRVIKNFSADTTVYLVGSCSFNTSTCGGYGHIIATRIA